MLDDAQWNRCWLIVPVLGLTLFVSPLAPTWQSIHQPVSSTLKSQNYRKVRVGRDLCGSSSPNPPAEAGSPRAGCTGPRPGGCWISPEKVTPQPLWAACSRAPSPSEGRSSSSCSEGTSSASVCACCLLSCHWAPLQRVCPHPPDTHPWDI